MRECDECGTETEAIGGNICVDCGGHFCDECRWDHPDCDPESLVGPNGMITIALSVELPDGTQGSGWARVAPDVSEETKQALSAMMAAALRMDRAWKKGDPRR